MLQNLEIMMKLSQGSAGGGGGGGEAPLEMTQWLGEEKDADEVDSE